MWGDDRFVWGQVRQSLAEKSLLRLPWIGLLRLYLHTLRQWRLEWRCRNAQARSLHETTRSDTTTGLRMSVGFCAASVWLMSGPGNRGRGNCVAPSPPPPPPPPGSKQPPCLPETPRFPKLRRLAGPQIRRCAPVSEVPDISAFLPNKSSWIFFLFPASIPLRIIGTWVYMQFFEIPSHIYIIFFILGTWMNAPSVCRL
jgi:hypothetical protein